MIRRLSQPTMLAFGIGQAAEGFKNQAFAVFLLFYYQQVVGISGTLAGLAVGIALFFDAITDPIAGVLSDRFKSRWGRRHPFMLAAAIPLAVSFVCLFSPPDSLSEFGAFLWLTVFAILVRGSITLFYVPHLALGAEMAHDYNQRSLVFAYSTVFSITAMALVTFIGYRYFFPTTELYSPGTLNPEAYTSFAITFAVAMVVVILVCCAGTAREIPFLRKSTDLERLTPRVFFGNFGHVFRNQSFRLIFVGMIMSTFAIGVESIFGPYMGVHFWGLPTERLAFISIATLVGLWIGLPLAPMLTRKLDKRWALVAPAIFVVINANAALCLRLADVSWFPSNDSPWIFWIYFTRYLLQGICLPVILSSFNSMFADIADEVELETGKRREGVIYAARSFANKAVAAFGALVGGILLDLIAFPRGAVAGTVPGETLWWLGFVEGPASSIISLAGVLFYIRYRINRKRHAEIMAEIDRRNAAAGAVAN
jgi:Na+/melibiose symporter-like transporter